MGKCSGQIFITYPRAMKRANYIAGWFFLFCHSFVPWMIIRLSLTNQILLASSCLVVNIDLLTVSATKCPRTQILIGNIASCVKFPVFTAYGAIPLTVVVCICIARPLSLSRCPAKACFIDRREFGGNRSFA